MKRGPKYLGKGKLRCSTCRRKFRPTTTRRGPQCFACWRVSQWGPRTQQFYALLESLLSIKGSVLRAAEFVGVTTKSLNQWRRGDAVPTTEHLLALDSWVRLEAAARRAESIA